MASEVLLGDSAEAYAAAVDLLSQWPSIVPHPERAAALGPTGWVFNLGHGVPKDADPATVERVVRAVHEYRFDAPVPQETEVTA